MNQRLDHLPAGSKPSAPTTPSARGAKKAIFVTILVVAMLFFVEAASMAVWKFQKGTRRGHVEALCGQAKDSAKYTPNAFWHHEINPRFASLPAKINSKGTKGPDFQTPKPPGELRIICVGDSTVEGINQPVEETFPFALEQTLNQFLRLRKSSLRGRVINAGISNHNSAFSLAYLAFRLLHYQPDIVVIKVGNNDYVPYVVPGMQYDYTHVFSEPFTLECQGINNPYWLFARYSYFLKLCSMFLFKDAIEQPYRSFYGSFDKTHLDRLNCTPNRDKLYIFSDNIRSMVWLCKGKGVRVVLSTLPSHPDFKDPQSMKMKSILALFNHEIETVGREEAVPVVGYTDLHGNDFSDLIHHTSTGNRKAAAAVFGTMLANGLADKVSQEKATGHD